MHIFTAITCQEDLRARVDNRQRYVKARFFEVNDQFHGAELGLADLIESAVGSFKIGGFGSIFGPFLGTGIKKASLLISKEHFHSFETKINDANIASLGKCPQLRFKSSHRHWPRC